MPRPRNVIPRFSVDKNGRAFTKVDGRFISLGRADDHGSKVRYGELLQRLAQGLPPIPEAKPAAAPAGLTVNELALAFLLHAEGEYCDHRTGKPSTEDEIGCDPSTVRKTEAWKKMMDKRKQDKMIAVNRARLPDRQQVRRRSE
jgi:hypothetical protein